MTATQILLLLQIIEALVPTINLLAQGMNREKFDIRNMTLQELLELHRRLEESHPDNWPDLNFQTPKNGG
jgi:hypothetical protein